MISGFGGAALDTIHRISHWPDPDNTTYIQESRTAAGGMTLGALIAAAKLGVPVSYMGGLGDDEEGLQLISAMTELGIKTENCQILQGEHSPASQIMTDPEGHRTIFHKRGLRSCDFHERLDTPSLDHTEILLLDGSWIKNSIRWAEEASKKSIPIVLDLSANNVHKLRDNLIRLADYPVLSEVLAGKITGTVKHREQLHFLQQKFEGRMIITAGNKGVFWAEENRTFHLPAFQVDTIDTTGAGDTFHGALAAALYEKQELADAICFAMAAAALKCTGRAQEQLPDRQTVIDFMEKSL